MPHKSSNLPKIVVAIGGLLMVIGLTMLGIAALSFSGLLNVDLLLGRKYLVTFAVAMVILGSLDAFSAIIITRW